MPTYTMTPILSGTRLRKDHTTFADIIDIDTSLVNIQSFNMDDLLLGDEIWEALADGSEVKKGDKWLHVTHRNGIPLAQQGWTAIIHKGVTICDNFKIVGDTDPIPPTTIFPESFILTDPSTNQSAEYSFVKVIE